MTAQVRVYKPRAPSRRPAAAAAGPIGAQLFRQLGLVKNRADLVKQIQRGFPVAVIEKLAEELRASPSRPC